MTEAKVSDLDDAPLDEWEILTEVVLALVSRPTAARVAESTVEGVRYYTIHVAPEDVGKVIGKNGETISSLRKLFGRIAAGRGRKAFVQIAETKRTAA